MNVIKIDKDIKCNSCNYLTTQGYVLSINNTVITICEHCKQDLLIELATK